MEKVKKSDTLYSTHAHPRTLRDQGISASCRDFLHESLEYFPQTKLIVNFNDFKNQLPLISTCIPLNPSIF